MIGLVIGAPLAIGCLVALGLAVAWVVRPVRTEASVSASAAWRTAVTHADRVSAAAWVALLVVALVCGATRAPASLVHLAGGRALVTGVALAVSPSVAGLAFLVVHGAGELTWPRPAGPIRRAVLARRPVRELVPVGPAVALAGWVLALAVLLVACGATSPDGRSVRVSLGSGVESHTGPYPGGYYGIPIAVAMVLLLAATAGVLRLVAARPSVSDTDPDADTALRRTSVARVLGGVQLVAALTFAGCLAAAAAALRNGAGGFLGANVPGMPAELVVSQLVRAATAGLVVAPAVVVVAIVVAVLSGRRRTSRRDAAAGRTPVTA